MPEILTCIATSAALGLAATTFGQPSYDVVWNSPSVDARGSMPLGNGDIGLNAWVSPDSDLIFYISKTDAWSGNGRLLKVGRVRVTVAPPIPSGAFEQRLNLADGTMTVRQGSRDAATTLRVWVDANHPLIHVTIESEVPRTATAVIERWRTEPEVYPEAEVSDLLEDRAMPNRLHREVIVEPDVLLERLPDRIGWYHHNGRSNGPDLIAELQGLAGFFKDQPDPLLGRAFGAVLSSPGAERLDDARLRSPAGPSHRFDIVVHAEHPASPAEWLTATLSREQAARQRPFAERRREHERWWTTFWNRSWIHVGGGSSPRLVPRNTHAVRIGIDQQGGNPFIGGIGRVTIIGQPLAGATIARLARIAHDRPAPPLPDVLHHATAGVPGVINGSSSWAFQHGLTIEAWIKPGDLPAGGGRILDKITPGAADGFLLDTYPGRGLRLLTGPHEVRVPEVFAADTWVHVAAVLDPGLGTGEGRLAVFLDGAEIASRTVDTEDDATTVSRGYALQRFVDACAGRGRYPIKFNGSIFTMPFDGRFGDADYRRWGPGYWWQNTRLPYMSMCTSGDFEMMRPLFRMYAEDLMPLHRYRTRMYTGHEGAFIPECLYFWGPTFTATYGWTPFEERGADKLQESPWHKWEWVSGPELVWMMLDYYEHTLDERFLGDTLLPAAHEILTFFDQHYPIDDQGQLAMHPAQALETWWDCTNPMPEVAGLRAVTARLLAIPEHLTGSDQRSVWTELRDRLPPLPMRDVDGTVMLAPAARFANKRNVENPELYAVFPFRLVSFEKPNAPLGREALARRWDRGHSGWRQDDLFMAYLGLADEARAALVSRARNTDPGSRFPAFWGPNYDWVPDQTHGGVLMRTLQSMLMQTEGRAIHLFPAWPVDWDVEFKLHAPYRTVVSGRLRAGELIDLTVEPSARRQDVIVHAPGGQDRDGTGSR